MTGSSSISKPRATRRRNPALLASAPLDSSHSPCGCASFKSRGEGVTMKAIKAITVLFVVAVMGSAFAQAEEAGDIKKTMKINYEKMGEMLGNILLDEDWDQTIKDAELLTKHAQAIRSLDPSRYTKDMPKSDYFESYALAPGIERAQPEGRRGGNRKRASRRSGEIEISAAECRRLLRADRVDVRQLPQPVSGASSPSSGPAAAPAEECGPGVRRLGAAAISAGNSTHSLPFGPAKRGRCSFHTSSSRVFAQVFWCFREGLLVISRRSPGADAAGFWLPRPSGASLPKSREAL